VTMLKCGVEGCDERIPGLTGLQELRNLMAHLKRAHLMKNLTMSDALEWRIKFEDKMDAEAAARKASR
jgi:hypothetical protein